MAIHTYKRCKACKQSKPTEQFVKADGKHRSTRNRCKDCHKEQADIRKRLKLENPSPPPGNCPICAKHTEKWVLDHCHKKGEFRGYLCKSCNAGIGLLDDNPVFVLKAFSYLVGNNV